MSEQVTRYYDGNTRSFLRFGRGSGATGAIHRALRAPGVRTQEEALNYIHHLIAEELKRFPGDADTGDAGTGGAPRTGNPPIVADLGCGVGAGMAWISRHVPGRYAGVTLSPVQAEIAARRPSPEGSAPFPVVVGSFDDPDTLRRAAVAAGGDADAPRLDAAYMIESFVHGGDAAATLAAIAEVMRPGGTLLVCDDLPTDELLAMMADADTRPAPNLARVRRNAAEFRAGWHINTFVSVSRLAEIARDNRFVLEGSLDLSAYVVVDRPRDYLLRMVAGPAAFFGLNSARWQNVRGGNALQYLEKAGLMEYRLLTLRRVE
ncbi:MAG: methyltransferase domain-containing protein [Spirochaeta sp.]|nr:methyltransferase domain-containing protein [Spirochaeta sp.]